MKTIGVMNITKKGKVLNSGYIKNISTLIGTKSDALIRVTALNKYFENIKAKS